MRRESGDALLSAVFVDYDNIYMSLRRKSEDAAKRFAKEAHFWLKAIETGDLLTPTNSAVSTASRRLVMNRCYGNPVPRRNTNDNATDMNSFPFVRHHFLRSGFEIIDCPPLTAQLKNSADIRMVMDVRDFLGHDTYFDEFVILSGDADFTPVLHRLRAHARRTVIYANEFTAQPYTAICDGEIRESDLIKLLLDGERAVQATSTIAIEAREQVHIEHVRREIIADVASAVRTSTTPVPLEVLADRAVRNVGHEKTVGTAWAGAGNFRDLLGQALPEGMQVSSEPPYVVVDAARHRQFQVTPRAASVLQPSTAQSWTIDAPAERTPTVSARASRSTAHENREIEPSFGTDVREQAAPAPQSAALRRDPVPPSQRDAVAIERVVTRPAAPRANKQPLQPQLQPQAQAQPQQQPQPQSQNARAPAPSAGLQRQGYAAPSRPTPPASEEYPPAPTLSAPRTRAADAALQAAPKQSELQATASPGRQAEATSSAIHQSIARIHDACQAPPLSPPEYRVLFETMAVEINENGLIGAQTIQNIVQRAAERGIEVRRDDARFALEVVSEADPWFEQGASANLFAGRFRNFVVARCRSQGLNLSADELDLIEAWFAGSAAPAASRPLGTGAAPAANRSARAPSTPGHEHPSEDNGYSPGWPTEPAPASKQREDARSTLQPPMVEQAGEDFPRIIRTRLRG